MNNEFMEPELEELFINSDSKADWALRQIMQEQQEFERLKNIAAEQINNITEKIKTEEQKYNNMVNYLKSQLYSYFNSVPHKETKTQESYKLLSGSLVKKKASQKMVKDDEQLVSYLQNNQLNEFIKTTYKPNWEEYKKHLEIVDGNVVDTVTGEIIEAVKVEYVPESFDIKL